MHQVAITGYQVKTKKISFDVKSIWYLYILCSANGFFFWNQ
jgi:hypothetical protein